MRTYSSYLSDWQSLTQNTTSANQALGVSLINDQIRYLATKFYFNEKSYTVPGGTVAQQQAYNLPPDFEVIEDVTIQTGGYLWQPTASPSRKHFDMINLIPYYNDFPQFFYIWNGQINIWPIPSSAANVMTINYKSRVTDLSQADVTTGTVSITTATTAVEASATPFQSWMAQSGWMKIAHSTTVTSTNGDNRWYQISSVTDSNSLNLINPYMGATVALGAYTIGDVPILPEDYQDIPLYWALKTYYTSIVPNVNQAKLYDSLYKERYQWLQDKYSSKDYTPVLTDTNTPVYNPNLFPRNMSQA